MGKSVSELLGAPPGTDAASLSYYEILGVPTSASPSDIRRAYRRLALRCHPDKNRDNPLAEEAFAIAFQANDTLQDPARRGAYDAKERLRIEREAKYATQNASKRAMRADLEDREREAAARRAASAGASVSQQKQRLRDELERLRAQFFEEDRERERKRAKLFHHGPAAAAAAAAAAPADAARDLQRRSIIVRWKRDGAESESTLRTIFTTYGTLRAVAMKPSSRKAVLEFVDAKAAEEALRDPELPMDFAVTVEPAQTKADKAEKAARDPYSHWDSLRPKLSFADYERKTLERLDQASELHEPFPAR